MTFQGYIHVLLKPGIAFNNKKNNKLKLMAKFSKNDLYGKSTDSNMVLFHSPRAVKALNSSVYFPTSLSLSHTVKRNADIKIVVKSSLCPSSSSQPVFTQHSFSRNAHLPSFLADSGGSCLNLG